MVTPAAIDNTSASMRNEDSAPLQARRDVAGLHRDDDHIGIGDRPRGTRNDANLRKELFEVAATVGVDLGDRRARRHPNRRRGDHRAARSPSSPRRSTRHAACGQGNRNRVRCGRNRRKHAGPRNLRNDPALPRTGPPFPHLGPGSLRRLATARATVALPLRALQDLLRHLYQVLRDPPRRSGASKADPDRDLEPALDELVEHPDDAIELRRRRGARATRDRRDSSRRRARSRSARRTSCDCATA